MWGIGRRTERTLNHMGIYSIYDLAHTDLALLEERFGVMGNQLYYHAWGIDHSTVGAPILQGPIQKINVHEQYVKLINSKKIQFHHICEAIVDE